ncbi:alpha/beta hydrolase fold domain-containing protein [Bordetella petrii]|nr:alpha/beta hydrolase fold domain-containing protein [Bordetella petrii]
MPLDPQIAAVLSLLEGMAPMETMPLDALRASMRYPPLEQRTAVAQVRDVEIACATHAIRARLYRPIEQKYSGLTVFFHGGGFVIGSLETHDHVCRDLCAHSGAAVLSVDYRLAPEHKFPAAPDDCLRAVRWAAGQSGSLDIDPSRLVLAGDSAGAALAAVTALRLRDEGGAAVRAQVLVYPVTDYHTPATPSYIENQSGYSLTRAAMIRFWDEYLAHESEAAHPHASPLRAPDLSGLPPTLLLTAEFDPLRDEGERFAHRLLDDGVPVTLWRHPGLIHGFFRMAALSDAARAALFRTAQWMGRAMA